MPWVVLLNQATGKSPSNISRMLPPPIAVTNEMINTPSGSSFFSMAANEPETAKLKVPGTSMRVIKLDGMNANINKALACLFSFVPALLHQYIFTWSAFIKWSNLPDRIFKELKSASSKPDI